MRLRGPEGWDKVARRSRLATPKQPRRARAAPPLARRLPVSEAMKAGSRLRSAWVVIAISAIVAGWPAAAPVLAATYAVTKTEDTNDWVCDRDCSLREAVIAANANPGRDTVEIPPGVYALVQAGMGEDAAQSGDLDLSDDVTLTGIGRGLAFVDAAGIDRVFQVHLGVSARLERLVIRGGVAVSELGAAGGGIDSRGDLDLWRVVVEQNRANRGGGISASIGTLTLDECSIAGNEAENTGFFNPDGGGIATGVVTVISNSTLNGNRAAGSGAAIRSETAGGPSGLTVENSTISDNLGTEAVSLLNADADFVHVTLADNEDVGIRASSFQSTNQLEWTNSIVAGNEFADCVYSGSSPIVVSRGNNLSSDASCGFTLAGDLESLDALLGPLQDNGGPTATRLLLPASPALDAGKNGFCVARDQRGELRPADGDGDGASDCDIGAVEVPEPSAAASGLASLTLLVLRVGRRAQRSSRRRRPRLHSERSSLASAAVLCAALLAGVADAATFVVDTTLDGVDLTPGNGICAATVGCTLRAAVQEANALSGYDTIVLGPGVHQLTLAGADEDLGATGDLDVTEDLAILGAGAAASVIDGAALDRVFDVQLEMLRLEDVTIRNGQVSQHNGAGIRTGPSTYGLVVLRSKITGNHCVGNSPTHDGGGGIFAESAVVVQSSTISGNSGQVGAGIAFTSDGTVEDSTIAGNAANVAGGGFSTAVVGVVTVRRSTISGNTAGEEGNSSAFVGYGGPIRLINSTVSGNSGGLGVVDLFDATLRLESSSVVANDSEAGFLLFGTAKLRLLNSIVSNQIAFGYDECDHPAQVTSEGYNLDSDGTCVGAGTGDQPSVDPMLRALADYGGPTRTHLPLPGSPVIDKGGPGIFGCTDLDGVSITQDQRGVLRPLDGNDDTLPMCDIGAVEYAPEPSVAVSSVAVLAVLLRWAARTRRAF